MVFHTTTENRAEVFAAPHLECPEPEDHASVTLRVGHDAYTGSCATLPPDEARRLGRMLIRSAAVLDARARL